MIAFYAGQIRRGKLTIEQVPALWRESVAAAIE